MTATIPAINIPTSIPSPPPVVTATAPDVIHTAPWHAVPHPQWPKQQSVSLLPSQTSVEEAGIGNGVCCSIPMHPRSINEAIDKMDSLYSTTFGSWIRNPQNLDYIALRLRPLCQEYSPIATANVLRWIGHDWTPAQCKNLFRLITMFWDGRRRRFLAQLLMRESEKRRPKRKLSAEDEAEQQQPRRSMHRPSRIHIHVPTRSVGTNTTTANTRVSISTQTSDDSVASCSPDRKLSLSTPTTTTTGTSSSSSTPTSSCAVVDASHDLMDDCPTVPDVISQERKLSNHSIVVGTFVSIPTTPNPDVV